MKTHRTQLVVILCLFAVLLIADVIATHNILTEPYPGHNDFMSRWEGARSFWRDGLNPYGDRASLNIQDRIFGRPAKSNEDPGFFAYPLYTVFLIWPLVYLSYAWASAIWMVLLETALIGAAVLLLDFYHWRLKPWLLAWWFIWTLVYYFAARGLILGQMGLLVYFLEMLVLWALTKKQDRIAGIALALSTVKPQMGFLFVPFLVLWGLRMRRWQFVGAFIVTWGLLMIASFALIPSWMGDWLRQLNDYPSYTAIGSPVWIVMEYYLGLGTVGEWAVNILLYGLLLWAWYEMLIRQRTERFAWTVMLTLVITHLTAVRTATPHFVVLTIPLVFYLSLVARKWGSGWAALILLLLLIIPWVHFFATLKGEFEHSSVYLPLPFGMFILLWLTRRQWWNQLSSAPTF